MILFEKLRYKNFLSTGNQFTEIFLNKSKSTLILGKNGSGKSTILDALLFVLYGKPYRNINKPQLVNSITQKNLLVEIEFSIGEKKYLIRRGMKPNLFEVIIDGSLLNQNADMGDYQEHLEKNILKMNYKSFCQIVVLGSANYTPFMQLSASDRRALIEDLLDIQIFTVMNKLLKDKISSNKSALQDIERSIEFQEEKIRLTKNHASNIRANNQEIIDAKEKTLQEIEETIESLHRELERLQAELDLQSEKLSAKKEKETIARKLRVQELKIKMNQKIDSLASDVEFFHEHDTCPTCNQDIDESFKTKIVSERNSKITELSTALTSLEKENDAISRVIDEINQISQEMQNISSKMSNINTAIASNRKNTRLIQEEIQNLKTRTEVAVEREDNTQEYLEELEELRKLKMSNISEREILNASSVLLKDTGIKSRIVKQYVPVINKFVNKYLSALDFFVNFNLDEKFEETIKSRHRDVFSYASFSEGEKFRIDISLMLTWRAVSKMRNSASTNLLIMDEVFDSSLDASGTEDFLKILQALGQETNIFVISHKGAELYDKFHSIIQFEKNKNFSQIVRR